MKSIIVSFILALIVSFTATAQFNLTPKKVEDKTLSPYFLIPNADSGVEQLPLLSTTADVHIAGVISDVTVKQVYRNTGKKPIEAIYVFPASTRAAVYSMTMYIGDRVLKAEIQKREEARKTYEQAKKEGKSASLLEQERPNVFQMNVANIMPGDTITVEMKYTELLIPTDGVYEFVYPTVVGPRYSNKIKSDSTEADNFIETPYQKEGEKPIYKFDIHVSLSSAVPFDELESPSHIINVNKISASEAEITLPETEQNRGNKDFILRYVLTGGRIESGLLLSKGDKENYFLLMLQPPRRVESNQIPPREFIFIVDVSGSMFGFPLDRSKALMKNLLQNLKPNEKFNILLFSGSSKFLSDTSLEATNENIQNAWNFVNKQQGGGGTELLPALQRALAYPKAEGFSRTIVIMTDGYVAVEQEAFELIRNNLNKANMFAFGIGTAVNRFLIEGIAKVGMGEPFVITRDSDAISAADKFRTYVESPVMTDIKIEYDGFQAYDVEPVSIPDVLASRPIIIYGKYRDNAIGKIVVSGVSGDTRYHVEIDALKFGKYDNSDALKYLWARNKISLLSDYNTIRGNDSLKDEITQLGLNYNLLTNYTSFVAVDYISRNNNADSLVVVKQAVPLPEGVSNNAVGMESNAMPLMMGRSMSVGGTGIENALAPADGVHNKSELGKANIKKADEEPDAYEFVAVEKAPYVDLQELQKRVQYPEMAKRAKIEGKVMVRVLVSKTGKPIKTIIEKSDNELLNDAAKKAIMNSTFTPAIQNGHPIDCWVTIPIQFKLKNEDSEKIKEISKTKIEVAIEKPDFECFGQIDKEPSCDLITLQKNIIYPELAELNGIQGEVIVRALIDRKGKVTKAIIEKSDSDILNKTAIEAVKNTKFKPAIKNKKPINCWISISMNFKLNDDLKTKGKNTKVEPDSNEIVEVEKSPHVDASDLKKKIVYPEIAKILGIQGKVIVKAFVDSTGQVTKTQIEKTDSKFLNEAAEKAVMDSKFNPALLNNKPVSGWVTLPITYKLDTDSATAINDFTRLPAGGRYKDINLGTGEAAHTGQIVTVNLNGYLKDGTKFEDTFQSGKPITFTLGSDKVIKAFKEGISKMKVGGKRILIVPPELGYGKKGLKNKVPPNSDLYFVIELIKVE